MSQEQVRITPQQCTALLTRVFCAAGIDQSPAAMVARHLVQAEIDGHNGHGLARIATYMTQVSSGKINPHARVAMEWSKPGFLQVDADCGFAFPAITAAIEAATARAKAQGAVFVAITNSHHAGALGQHVEAAAEQGLVALMMCNAPAAIAPWGGHKPLFGTNPLAFACPRVDSPPLVLDMSLSRIARGKIVRARALGESIPLGWALDKDGNPTSDAQAAIDGTMIPIGEAKGAALAMMVELLTAGLAGAHFGFEASSFLDGQGQAPRTAQALILIAPHDLDAFARKAETLFAAILAQEGTRLPSAGRAQRRALAHSEGFEIVRKDYELMLALAGSLT